MTLTNEEMAFVEKLIKYCNKEFVKHKNKHKGCSVPLCNIIAVPNVDCCDLISQFTFDFNKTMFDTRTVFKRIIESVLTNIHVQIKENLFHVKLFKNGHFSSQTITFVDSLEALDKAFNIYFSYLFNNSWLITHFKGLSIGMQYEYYRRVVLLSDEFPEIEGTFQK